MDAVHDLPEIRAYVLRQVWHLCRAIIGVRRYHKKLHEYRKSRSKDRLSWIRAEEKLKHWLKTWDNVLLNVFNGLKGCVPPRVRTELWEIDEFNKLDGIGFKIARPEEVWPLEETLAEWVRQGRNPAEWRIVTRSGRNLTCLPAFFCNPSLELDWPDVKAAIKVVKEYFEQCEAEAQQKPSDFRLAPLLTDDVAQEIRLILERYEIPRRKRLELSLFGDPHFAIELSLSDKLMEFPDWIHGPDRGCHLKELRKELRHRWPKLREEPFLGGILEALRQGWLSANGGPRAAEHGYTIRTDGEIVDDTALERWLRQSRIERRCTLVFRLQKLSTGTRPANVAESEANSPAALDQSEQSNRRSTGGLVVDEKGMTISWDGRTIRCNGSETWSAFIALWKARPEPVDLANLTGRDGPDIARDVKEFLRKHKLTQLAASLKVHRNIGHYLDYPR